MSLLGPKKDGGPNVEFFQSPESMQGFDQVRQWLQKNCKKVSIRRVIRHSTVQCTAQHTAVATAHIPAILKIKQNIQMELCQNNAMNEIFSTKIHRFSIGNSFEKISMVNFHVFSSCSHFF